jgi:hypothetical protein
MGNVLVNLALVCGSLALTTLCVDKALSLAGVHFEASLHMADPDRGWALRPGARGWSVNEGRQYVVINGDGMRDREHARTKPAGTIRIAVIGDSFAAALAVPMEDAFWSVLERQLSTCSALASRRIEVLNFGVPGYGTAQELITLRKHESLGGAPARQGNAKCLVPARQGERFRTGRSWLPGLSGLRPTPDPRDARGLARDRRTRSAHERRSEVA